MMQVIINMINIPCVPTVQSFMGFTKIEFLKIHIKYIKKMGIFKLWFQIFFNE